MVAIGRSVIEVHVPHLPDRDLGLGTEPVRVERDRLRSAACERARVMPPHARDGEVVAKARHARLPQQSDALEDLLDLLVALGAVQQNVMPVARIEILDCVEGQAGGRDLRLDVLDLLERPRISDALRTTPSQRSPTPTTGYAVPH